MSARELYGIDIPITVAMPTGSFPAAMHIPGWVNLGVLVERSQKQEPRPSRKQRRKQR